MRTLSKRVAVVAACLSLLGASSALAALPFHSGIYTGKNSDGHTARLRVSKGGLRIVRLNAGSISAHCGGGIDTTEPTDIADVLRVRADGSFHNRAVNFTSGNAGAVRGRFVSRRHVTGHVAVSTRDDCSGKASFDLHLR
jgi:hypothetical protein